MKATRIVTCVLFFLFVSIPVAYAQGELEKVPPTDPEYELSTLNMAEGYEINLFASDPMIEKPIQMTWDEAGRLWIVGSPVYPALLPGQKPNDKVFVLEDTDGDGVADRSTVFADGLLTPTGILVGDGGVYVANSTELLHFVDEDGDLVADSKRVVLRGFGADDTHHIIHSFRWGPDGRMYINQSIYIFSHIETPWGVRRLRQGGIWRFQPESLKLDVFVRGFVNAWGHEFDTYGQSFVTDGAYGEGINHAFPEATFVTAYQAPRILKGLNSEQPKHAGLAIISGRHFPDSLQGHLVTNDFRANKVNRFALTEDEGSYHSRKAENLVWSNNVAFRPVDVSMGPDGALYLVDWYNPIIQHGEVDFKDPRRDRVHGRIWRITAKDRPLVVPPDFNQASISDLLDALLAEEAWTQGQARRLLKEAGSDQVLPHLAAWRSAVAPQHQEKALLESVWLHQAFDTPAPDLLDMLLDSQDHNYRAAGMRVLLDWHTTLPHADSYLETFIRDEHPRVRREALTVLGTRGHAEAAPIALKALDYPLGEFEDFALWHTIRTLAPQWIPAFEKDSLFLGDSDQYIAYALKALDTPFAVHALSQRLLENRIPDAYALEVLDLIAASGTSEHLDQILDLALSNQERGGLDPAAYLNALERAASVYKKQPSQNTSALLQLLTGPDSTLYIPAAQLAGQWELTEAREPLLERILDSSTPDSLRSPYLKGLARLSQKTDFESFQGILSPDTPLDLRFNAIEALCDVAPDEGIAAALGIMQDLPENTDVTPLFKAIYRANQGYDVLTAALDSTTISAEFATAGLSTFRGNRQRHVNMLEALIAQGGIDTPPKIDPEMGVWGIDRIATAVKGTGDTVKGEAVYQRPELACVSCHKIEGQGGAVGPDLSTIGAQAPIDYLISSLLKPESAVKDGYALIQVTRKDGTSVSGILVQETPTETRLRNAGDQIVVVPASQIASKEIRSGSLMPATAPLLLEREEFIDLVAFLSSLRGETTSEP